MDIFPIQVQANILYTIYQHSRITGQKSRLLKKHMAHFDTITGVIARRVMLNYRIDQDVAREILPSSFSPQLFHRYAIGGLCLMQFADIEGNFLPVWMGPNTDAVSYRIAVTWEEDGEMKSGHYIPRRESNSFLNRNLGDKAFTGIVSRSKFETTVADKVISMKVVGIDDRSEIEFLGRIESEMPNNSVFSTLEEVSEFLRKDSVGYSPALENGYYHGLETTGLYHGIEIDPTEWVVEPMSIGIAESTFFDDRKIFPPGSIEVDSALVMQNVVHSWNSRGPISAGCDPRKFCNLQGFKGLTTSNV